MLIPQCSRLEKYLATLPDELVIIALKAIKEEYDRWGREDLTKEEFEFLELAKQLGQSARESRNKIIIEVLNDPTP